MGYVRELNEGVNRIYQSMEQSMLSEPKYVDADNIARLTLENKISGHKKTIPDETMNYITKNWNEFKETERLIFSKLFKDQEATIDELSDSC